MEISQLFGFAGTAMVLAAYVPQIGHLIKAHCSGGVSESAFFLWFLASIFLLVHALTIRDVVFIILQGAGTIFNGAILLYAHLFEHGICPTHGAR